MIDDIKTILAIDTSCDETSVAVTCGTCVLSNVISSQLELHKKWGGVVPGLARDEHRKRIDGVVEEALNIKERLASGKERLASGKPLFDAVAVTRGPGLALALEVGIEKAKELALAYNVPLIAVDHMEGHLFSSIAKNAGMSSLRKQGSNVSELGILDPCFRRDDKGSRDDIEGLFPALGILVSGGHTQLVLVSRVGEYEIIGETLDDAIGEAFDKVAKILGLGYPGGPVVSKLAEDGDSTKYDLPVAMRNLDNLDVSYSGLKTAVLYLVRRLKGENLVQERAKQNSWKPGVKPSLEESDENALDEQVIKDICASFQYAAIETLMNKVRKALKTYKFESILLGGGVARNKHLVEELQKAVGDTQLLIPQEGNLFMDNAAMIGVAAYLGAQAGTAEILTSKKQIMSLDRDPGMRLG